jgi:hypothetical protein
MLIFSHPKTPNYIKPFQDTSAHADTDSKCTRESSVYETTSVGERVRGPLGRVPKPTHTKQETPFIFYGTKNTSHTSNRKPAADLNLEENVSIHYIMNSASGKVLADIADKELYKTNMYCLAAQDDVDSRIKWFGGKVSMTLLFTPFVSFT